ncbi:helix-turn-helix domain-containing protein [Sphingobacterium faecium]|uniref:helix-turn-helix domain-containing protein n=1 Tax=Sphingobacterium faecium TaxID=34087 RepID=UPI000B9B41BE|nr:AraC family transcriptional regulator [Sphingobacterium sp.]
MLYITSNHLNFICKDQINMSAGEIIRNRVLLEAKRMLVNFELSVATIGMELNFFDTSYFIKFFKKYTLFTPEAFRKQYYNKS